MAANRDCIKSECGKYYAREIPDGVCNYELFDASGTPLGRCTWWSNANTSERIRFTTGVGNHEATFSHARYPSWFKRRWVSCFDIELEELEQIAIQCGCEVLVGYKLGWNCWHNMGLKCSSESIAKFDKALTDRKVKFDSRKRSRSGQWDIGCPDEHRHFRRVALPVSEP